MEQFLPVRDPQPTRPGYAPLVLLLAAASAGIVLDREELVAFWTWLIAAWGALLVAVAVLCLRRERVASCLLLMAGCAAGGAWHHAWWRLYPADEIGRLLVEDGQPLCVEAVAITSPRWVPAPPPSPLATIPQGEETELLVYMTRVRSGESWRPASGYAQLVVLGNLTEIQASDHLRIMAQAARPASPLNPGEFDFSAHERARRVQCRLLAEFPQSVERLRGGSAWSPRRWLGSMRGAGAAQLRALVAPSRSTLAAAILLGAREQLDRERNENYLVTGTIHVLSISGLHVAILAAGLFLIFRSGLLPRTVTLVAVMAVTLLYALLTDMQPPVVRATILVICMCLAWLAHRRALGYNSLAMAAIAVLAINPASLFQAGPQLSFLAVATIIAFQPHLRPEPIADPLDRLIAATRPWPVRTWRWLRDYTWRLWLTGAVIWLVSAPLVWKHYNLVSPAALVLNVIVLLPVAIALYAGFGALLVGWLVPPLGRLAATACDVSLACMEQAVAWGRGLPLGHLWLPAPPWWWIGAFYVGALALVLVPPLRETRRWVVSFAVLWCGVAVFLAQPDLVRLMVGRPRPLACSFIAVGHGASVLVELPDGANLLYDAGRLGSPSGAARPIASVLWSRGIRRLDAVVVSHADADHYNALPELLERFQVDAIYVSPVMFEENPPGLVELRAAIERSGAQLREVHSGQPLRADSSVTLEVLHPPSRGVLGSDNANSIVLELGYAGRRILLTGDLESPGLDDVLAEEPLDCDVVLAPHHGSPRSAPGQFADWCTPNHVVISGGRSLADVPAMERVKDAFRLRGAEVYHTSEDGAVHFEVTSAGIVAGTLRPHVRGFASRGPLFDPTRASFLQSE